MDKDLARKQKLQSEQWTDTVLILTPVKDAENFLVTHLRLLGLLSYPHNLISIGFLESDSLDKTYSELEERLPELRSRFRSVGLWKKDFGFHVPSGLQRWSTEIQIQRRSVLARSRNHLLFSALKDEEWVLWMDADLVDYPQDIIEKLLLTGKSIVQPHCVNNRTGRTFDLNAWRDKGKRHMEELRKEGDLVRLHAVGGSMLLVKADLHRDGLIFPPFLFGAKSPLIRRSNKLWALRDILKRFDVRSILQRRFRGEIETEGLGIMAHEMGQECWGMPNLEIKHRDG